MASIQKIPIQSKVVQNVDESVLRNVAATLENGYVNDMGGLSRFPQLKEFKVLSGSAPVYLEEWRGDLVASTGGRTYTLDKSANAVDRTETSVVGVGRTIFAKTEDELLMAAGGDIVRLSGEKTEILSTDAPQTTHVGFLPSGYVAAIEPGSGRFRYSDVGAYRTWPALNIFSASGKADNVNALMVSEFGELLIAGTESIEQYEEASNGDVPFYRRWFLGSGLYAPYTLLSVDNRIWGINSNKEFVAFSAQLGRIESSDIQAKLEALDDWSGAWAVEVPMAGHRFMLLQVPNATNAYGTKGVTLLFDYLKKRWSFLYGWDDEMALPTRWPGWSFKQCWDRAFVGGNGVIYELVGYEQEDFRQRFLWRSGHITTPGKYGIRLNSLLVTMKRGMVMPGANPPTISLRINKDNRGFGRWVRRSIGIAGERDMVIRFPAGGVGKTWQFEIEISDPSQVEIAEVEMEVEGMA